ncbi:hypothetical protein C8J57DRAFT_1538735 [Mycena rebaudengoi]|nr:hypothetical protein C8J57DRAFT_1538735 [Mycena rebaudengoi]
MSGLPDALKFLEGAAEFFLSPENLSVSVSSLLDLELPPQRKSNTNLAAGGGCLVLNVGLVKYVKYMPYIGRGKLPSHPQGDITHLISSNFELALVKQVFMGLVEIGGMELGIGNVGESHLVATGATSGGMVIYQRTDGGKNLVEFARNSSAVPRTSAVMRAL